MRRIEHVFDMCRLYCFYMSVGDVDVMVHGIMTFQICICDATRYSTATKHPRKDCKLKEENSCTCADEQYRRSKGQPPSSGARGSICKDADVVYGKRADTIPDKSALLQLLTEFP